LLKDNSKEKLKEYFTDILKILERWMNVMCKEEGEIISALIIDQLFKSIMIKLDHVFLTQEEYVEQEHHCSDLKVKEIR
jgi:hypothetical protein